MDHPKPRTGLKPRDVVKMEPGTRCHCCDRRLNRGTFLEYNQETDTYSDDLDVPTEHSLGCYPFGTTCASAALGNHFAKKYNDPAEIQKEAL